VYLTQAVQSLEFPVPLVAGEQALLRVFLTANAANSAVLPGARARFYANGEQIHAADIPPKSGPIPTEVNEGHLAMSVNAEIPGTVVRPGLEIVIEIDPVDGGLGVPRRIPETGRLAVEVREMPPFDLTLIPFIWTETHDSAVVELIEAVAADPESHDLLQGTRTLLPVADLTVTAHDPVLSSSNNSNDLLRQATAIRALERGRGYYMGMMSDSVRGPSGIAPIGGRASFSVPGSVIMAHELGHNLSLRHAPCGNAGGPDPGYPYADGSTGAWGYDFRDGGKLVQPDYARDLMTYCGTRWISDYHFTNALRFRLHDEGTRPNRDHGPSGEALLLWGGTDANGIPFLEPTFVVDAPAALPDSSGAHVITGRTASGAELFSVAFTMPEIADGDGSSSFAFVLPARPGWEDDLARITLSGPGGSFTLDNDNDVPMAILRDPRTGQVRGFLHGPPAATQAAADARATGAPGLEVLFSRGIPGADAWRR
ncbi:MAG: hypothetical protein F4059_03765, partial [Gemmatimonadetes bacterium]|nr:hypothetical protein [Gemmatimonadota bacterium]